MRERKLSRYFFAAVLLLTVVLFFFMVRLFALPVLLAAVFASLFYPFYSRLVGLLGGRRSFASLLCCFLLLGLLIVPVYLVVDLVTREAIDFYHSIEEEVRKALAAGPDSIPNRILRQPWARRFGLHEVDWTATAREAAQNAGGFVAVVIRGTYRSTFHILLVLLTTMFTMFYFFRDGPRLVERMKYLIPLSEPYENAIIARFRSVVRATIRGTLVIALIQGVATGVTLWAFGVGSAILWAVVATVFAIIPMAGAWVVLVPAGLIQILSGNVGRGIGILIVSVAVVSQLDNLVRPRLVGRESGMHDLMVFFATLGGIATFGPMGFIVGPVIAALFLAVLDIYSTEFRQELDFHSADPAVQTAVAKGGVTERSAVPPQQEIEDATRSAPDPALRSGT